MKSLKQFLYITLITSVLIGLSFQPASAETPKQSTSSFDIAQLPALIGGNWYVATTGNDANDCATSSTPCATINGAIGKATNGDTILVATGTYTGSGTEVMLVNKSVTLSGGWDAMFSSQNGYSTIDGQDVRRGVYVNGSVTASLDRFIVKNGSSDKGGGVYNAGYLTITYSSIQNNSAAFGGGGGIYKDGGNLTLNNTTVSNNSAGAAGGIFNYQGSLTLNNSTISNNSAAYDGGGIYNNAGSLTLNNTTLSNNSASRYGGGIYNLWAPAGLISNSILAGNTAFTRGPDCFTAQIISGENNLIGNTSDCTIIAAGGNQLNVDPKLGIFLPEQGYQPLRPGSPAIDAGNPATCLPADQRGVARVGTCDIGAYEYTAPGPATHISVVSGSGQRTRPSWAFAKSLQVVALDSQGSPVSNVAVTLTAPTTGASGTFTASGTNTTSVLTNQDGVATASTFTANAEFGGYQVSASASGLASTNFDLQNAAWYVSPAGEDANSCARPTTPCQTINGAINKAVSGDTIFIATGIYTGSGAEVLFVNKRVTLSGGWDATFSSQNGYATLDAQNARRGIYLSNVITNLDRFIVRNGSSDKGGGVYNAGNLTITNSSIQDNSASGGGGGIYNGGSLELNTTTISHNSAASGGGIFNTGNAVLNTTTLSYNSASGGGGGIYNYDLATMDLNNTTLSHNSAAYGGAIFNNFSNSALNNTTITNNSASEFGGGIFAGNGGEGFASFISIRNSILGKNTALTSGPNCYVVTSSTINSSGNNLISNTSGCAITAASGDQFNIDPMLGPLADNGGPTQTMALLSGSPAINTGNPATCLPTDQRGAPRVGICDIGAYEFNGFPTISGNAGVGGATLSYVNGTLQTVTADGSGNYSITVPYSWSGTVTPSLSTDVFCPSSQAYNNLTTNKILQNYAHAPCPNLGSIGKWTPSFDLSHGWTVKDYVRTVGDVNGDGDADLVGFGLDGVYVALSNGTGFDAISKWTSAFDLSHGWTVASYVRTVGDVNGDGKADLVGFGLDGVYVALANGTSFDAVSKWTSAFDLSHGWTVKDYVRTVGDVNGDGNADLVGFGLDGVYVALSNGSGFDAVSKWTSAFDLSHGWTVKDYVRTVGDVNGDNKADLVGFGLDGVYVALSNGASFDAISKWTSGFALANGWTVKDYVRTVGDVDGDGKADIVGFGQDGVYISLSMGNTFSLPSRRTTSFDLSHGWTVAQYVRTAGDVNGDGKDDLVGFGQDGVYIVPAQ